MAAAADLDLFDASTQVAELLAHQTLDEAVETVIDAFSRRAELLPPAQRYPWSACQDVLRDLQRRDYQLEEEYL